MKIKQNEKSTFIYDLFYFEGVSQGIAGFQLDYSHPEKGKTTSLEENSQSGSVPFPRNGNYISLEPIPYILHVAYRYVSMCIPTNLFLLSDQFHQYTQLHINILIFNAFFFTTFCEVMSGWQYCLFVHVA